MPERLSSRGPPGDGDDMATHLARTQQVFKALADPTRREILSLLRQGEQPVNGIAGHFSMSRPAVSKHLRLLRDARLLSGRRQGRSRLYQLNPVPLREVDDWL